MNRQRISDTINKTATQVRWWSYAAWTAPFAALAILAFESLIGWDNLYSKSVIIISVIFFTVSVFWWWWALHRFVDILDAMRTTQEKIDDVKKEIVNTRDVIRETDPRNR
jgi:hypothetical protein